MEDEDGESINVDSWPMSEQMSFKDSSYVCETLNNKAKNNVSDYVDGVEENKEETSSEDKVFNSKIIFKGFKKRILAQTQENQLPERIINQDLSLTSSPKSSKDRNNDNKRGKITEYAQYLGLQPTGKYKCPKCNPIVTFRTMAMLKQHQCVCTSNTNLNHGLPSTSDQHKINNKTTPTNNFRISRKVYLCAACGTYFENWNLFLHMREIHKRHICLFCLGMFGQAERLSHHLVKKHSVPETQFHTIDDFYTVFKGSCYLICCMCEKVFSETDNFYTHNCVSLNQRIITNSLCSVCRQTDGKHLSTCKHDINYERTNFNDRIQASDSEQTLFPNPANAVAKKLLGANKSRLETNERALLSSYKRKLLNLYARNINSKSRKQYSKIINRNCESSVNTMIDSAAAAAAAVTKFDDDREHNRLMTLNNTIKEQRHIVEIDVTKSPAHEIIIDRYTDTIMQVSQCKNIKDYDEFETNFDVDEMDEESDADDIDDYNRINNFDDISDNIEKGELILDDGNDDTPIASPSTSPNHLNFTPIQEPIIQKLDQLNSPRINLDDAIECNNITEESPSLTVSRVNSTNRSLVIKICTNKNSQFSVTTPNVNGNYDNNNDDDDDDDDDDDEENYDEDDDDEEEDEDDGESEDNNKSGGSEKEELSINDHGRDSEGENLIAKLPEELNNKNNIEPTPATIIIPPTIMTTEDDEGIKAPEITTDLSPAKVTVANESVAELNEEEKKIDETSQTKETTFEIDPPTSESMKINNENESLNVDVCKSSDIIIDETKESLDDKPDENNSTNDKQLILSDGITLAADEIPSIDINVDGTLDSIEIEDLLKRCIEAASPTCIYCNHARHIAVNGKQLALHMLAEHRFQPQHPAIIIQHDQFNGRVKKSLDELTSRWFNLDSYDNTRGTYNVSTVKIYECYLCHIYYSVHKELCLHNRKMHQKTILICIMCKSTFYSHSELVCHLCPGIYSSHINIRYRCCLCDIESLPSAFRLMVHLRKRHHACDVCLESTGNQQRLSNHVWKHKLHHLCYRCGIAYRNKPDITKHLFWKHGTESVLCKKCLQKKWPHIYHFCIPPSAFVCEECGATFSRAVALKVHKRLHTGDEPHECLECSARFISKKLLSKHADTHKPLPLKIQSLPSQFNDEQSKINADSQVDNAVVNNNEIRDEFIDEVRNNTTNVQKENVKKVLDVYDLPPLNLSSDSDTDIEDDKLSLKKENEVDKLHNVDGIHENDNIDVEMMNLVANETDKSTMPENFEVKLDNITDNVLSTETNDSIRDVDESNEEEIKKEEVVIMNGIWDNFKSYTASLEVKEQQSNIIDNELPKNQELLDVIAAEHDYCTVYDDDNSKEEHEIISNAEINNDEIKGELSPLDEINVSANGDNTNDMTKRKTNKSPKKKNNKQSQEDGGGGSSSSSDSSSDSDSSSCSCGTNCSCSSSSSGSSTSSSSSSDSDSSTSESSPKKLSVIKKERRKDKDTKKNRIKDLSEASKVDVEIQIETKNGSIQSIDNGVDEPTENDTNQQTVDNIILPPAPSPLRESDLETDETETDEDFYDEYPQQHANNILAEKRNQLMLLATVAPQSADDSALGSSSNDMKNGIVDNSIAMTNSPSQQSSLMQTGTNIKRKIKTKRRKKGEGGRGRGKRQQNSLQSTAPIVNNPLPIIESIKLNIPKILYRNKKPGVRRNSSSPNVNTAVKTREPKLPAVTYQISQTDYNINQIEQLKTPNAHNTLNDNESANENKRSSKRKRVPKKFYGDSSDEEHQQQNQQRLPNSINQKWRRIDSQIPTNSYVPSITIKQNYGPPSSTFQSTTNYQTVPSVPTIIPEPESEAETHSLPISSTPAAPEPTPVSSAVDSDDPPDGGGTSSDSSTSETEQQPRHHPPRQHPGENNDSQSGTTLPNRQANLYCYCQCPYDEVSEMIACDGDSCRIEWFHFECVGIMVPPKGKWYCPDCSKRDPTLPSNEYFV